MTQSIHNGFGATRFPLPTVTTGAELDPGAESLLRLLEAAINADAGDAWRSVLGILPPGHFLSKYENKPVGTASRTEVSIQNMAQFVARWPLLAVYREGEPTFEPCTTSFGYLVQNWSVDYIIGPLDPGDQKIIGSLCNPIARLIRTVLHHGYHPAYQNGVRQFMGQFSTIGTKAIQGPNVARDLSTGESGVGYFGMTIVVETRERDVLDGYAPIVHAPGDETPDVIPNSFETVTGYVPAGTGTATVIEEIRNTVNYDNKTPEPE